MNNKKTVKYLGKDFNKLETGLINFAKVYYPNTYNDFNPASPGMMFIDMASYVGDVLNYYLDSSVENLLLLKNTDEKMALLQAQALGYKPKLTTPAFTKLDVFIVIPSKLENGEWVPDYDYALTVKAGLEVESTSVPGIIFRTTEDAIFKGNDSVEIKIYNKQAGTDLPNKFILKTSVNAYSGTSKTVNITVPSIPEKYWKFQLADDEVIEILSITDSAGNNWYETKYLAQDTIFYDQINEESATNEISSYLLKLKLVPKRFITRINKNKKMEIQFGSGISSQPDEYIIPNPTNVGAALPGLTSLDNSIDPSNFIYTKTYGEVPYNTTLSVKYVIGGGIKSNTGNDTLQNIRSINWGDEENNINLNSAYVTDVKSSIGVTNPEAAKGGGSGETIDEIVNGALANFSTQNRAVTKEDYLIRLYAMPSKYGKIAKGYINQETATKNNNLKNPLALNLYLLGYNSDGTLSILNDIVKDNIKVYLNEFRLLTDAINIRDSHIINIAVKVDLITFNTYSKNEVILRCIDKLKDYFKISDWQINQPIILTEIMNSLLSVEGVKNVNNVIIENRWQIANGYSGNFYDITRATRDGIIYPAKDPSIFEIKYPNSDIQIRAK